MEGSYEIISVIGRSGLGSLYQARFEGESGFSKLVTLKMLDEGVADSDEVACRLRDEARVLGILKHQAVVQVDRLARLNGRWTLVQEHVDGVSLESIIEAGPVSPGPALEIVAGVAGALHAAYTTPGPDGSPLRLQHRDIKPSAILLDAYGAPKVTDFGIARACFVGREARTRSFVVGSFEYMAPERLALEEGGPWSDIYSLGQVLYALLMGHSFGRSHPSERHHKAVIDRALGKLLARPGGVDEGLLSLLQRMLALEPHERPDARSVERSCHELVRELRDESLRGWAELTVEPMLLARASATQGGLVGKILREGEEPSARPVTAAPPDPSLVQDRPPRPPPRPTPTARRELEPIPVHSFDRAAGEDDATEIMPRVKPGESPARHGDDEHDAAEVFAQSLGVGAARSGGRDPSEGAGAPQVTIEAEDIDLSVPRGPQPVFGAHAAAPVGDDEPSDPELNTAESFDWPSDPGSGTDPSLDDDVRPTVVQDAEGEPFDLDDGARPTTISWHDEALEVGQLDQGPGEVTAVASSAIGDPSFDPFAQSAADQDEKTLVGEDLETARAERSELARIRFDLPAADQEEATLRRSELETAEAERRATAQAHFSLPAGDQEEHTALGEDIDAARSERSEMAQVRFDLPAADLDEHTAIGQDIEQARSERGEMAQVRFDQPAGALDQPTALGEDIDAARSERSEMAQVRFDQPAGALDQPTAIRPGEDRDEGSGRAAAQPRVHFDAPETAASPLPPALELPSTAPPPPAQPLPHASPSPVPPPEPPPASPAALAPPLGDPGLPDHRAQLASDEAPSPPEPPPPPPAPPRPPGAPDPGAGDQHTHSQAKPWSPGAEGATSQRRPQLDHWEPPSVETLVKPAPERSALTPAPMPEPGPAPTPVPVQVESSRAEDGPRPEGEKPPTAPVAAPAAPAPAPSPGVDATVARGSRSAATPVAEAPVAGAVGARTRKGPNKLLLALLVLVVLAFGLVVLAGGGAAAWYFLLR
jgi:serine/threonine protein kinase